MSAIPRRDITKLAQIYWDKNKLFRRSNTEICIIKKHSHPFYPKCDFVALALFGNIIATKELNENGKNNGIIVWSMRGYGTTTTRERLSIIGVNIRQKDYRQEYFDELKKEWIHFNPFNVFEYNQDTKEIKKLRDAHVPKTVIDSNGTIWTPLF